MKRYFVSGVLLCMLWPAAQVIAGAKEEYVTGILVDITKGDELQSTSIVQMPPAFGGASIPITAKSTKYLIMVKVGNVVNVGETGWDKQPKGFIISDPILVRFSDDGGKMWALGPKNKEYKTKLIKRMRVVE